VTELARRDRRQAELAQRRDSRKARKVQPARKRSLMMPLTIGSILIGVAVIAAIAFWRQDVPNTQGINEPMAYTAYGLADGRAIGAATAPVTIEVWSDYQCPFCQRFATSWENALVDKYAANGKVRIVYRDYAFIGDESVKAAAAARAAEQQGKYWQFHDYLFANQNGENGGWFSEGRLQGIAQAIGLDLEAFNAARSDAATRQAVVAETAQGRALGITGTPTIAIGGQLRTDLTTWDKLDAAVADAVAKATP
jgi:protein-disulfide isomerase